MLSLRPIVGGRTRCRSISDGIADHPQRRVHSAVPDRARVILCQAASPSGPHQLAQQQIHPGSRVRTQARHAGGGTRLFANDRYGPPGCSSGAWELRLPTLSPQEMWQSLRSRSAQRPCVTQDLHAGWDGSDVLDEFRQPDDGAVLLGFYVEPHGGTAPCGHLVRGIQRRLSRSTATASHNRVHGEVLLEPMWGPSKQGDRTPSSRVGSRWTYLHAPPEVPWDHRRRPGQRP